MNFGLDGRVALVTAGSRGIGRAIGESLAAEGARVALVARHLPPAEEAVDGIRAAGGVAFAVEGDVSNVEDVRRIAEEVRRSYGDPAILVANAGGPPSGVPSALEDAQWCEAFELTLMSSVRLAREVVPAMRASRWGRIINITSLSVREPIPTLTTSNALRAAVTGYAKTLSEETAADGVTVNNVAPGYTATERFMKGLADDVAKRALIDRIPVRRFAEPSEIAAAVTFLASEQAGYITGQTLTVDGGTVRSLM